MSRFNSIVLLAFALAVVPLDGQTPVVAQTDLYFPHLADGGPTSGQWQTRFTLINPNSTQASVSITTYSDGGAPLTLNFGNGLTSQTLLNIPANGTVVLTSQISSSVTTTGWAVAGATLPILANVAFRLIVNGTAKLEITAAPTLPSTSYRAMATPQVGVAVANVYSAPLTFTVMVYGSRGQVVGQGTQTIPAYGHSSFNLSQVPNVPSTFTGNVVITPQTPGQVLLAWAVYSDSSGVISSLPDGRARFPLSQLDQINNTFQTLIAAYQQIPSVQYGNAPQLVISPESDANAINAHASNGATVQINLAVAELISDSPSELAFIIAHEMGHIYQQRTGNLAWNKDPEWDADQWGLLAELLAGYDPYAGAGALGKLAMATATAGLQAQLMQGWEQMTGADAHGSFAQRIDNLTTFVETICGYSQPLQAACQSYKSVVHPHFPTVPSVPLLQPGPLGDVLNLIQSTSQPAIPGKNK